MYRKCILLLLAALCIFGAYADNCATTSSWSGSLPADSLTTFTVTYNPVWNVVFNFVNSSDGTTQVALAACSSIAQDSTLSGFTYSLTEGASSIMLALNLGNPAGSVYPSSAHKSAVMTPLLFLMVAVSSLFFVLPKGQTRLNLVILAVVLCLGLAAAASTVTITVNVQLPPQITQVCENSKCYTWPLTDSEAESSGINTGGNGENGSGDAGSGGTTTTTGPVIIPVNPPSYYVNIRILILAGDTLQKYQAASAADMGGDWAALQFTTVGTPYDFIVVNKTSDLSGWLPLTATAAPYSGIVVINTNLLSDSQEQTVAQYQKTWGVKRAVVASNPQGMAGVTAGAPTGETDFFYYTLAPAATQIAPCLNPNARVNNTYVINWSGYGLEDPSTLTPATVTDSSTVTPVILAELPDGTTGVAAAVFVMADGTQQLHYFMDQASDFIFAQVFGPILVNWISPATIFIGARRLTLAVQPDDLLLASNIWDVTEHTDLNADLYYRITDTDYENLADFFDAINALLPAGSSWLTVEWPINFSGYNDWSLEGAHDYLYDKVQEKLTKFYYLSHTWDHPCPMDNYTYEQWDEELGKNVNFTLEFFGTQENMDNLWTSNGMITPCVTGLHNPNAIQAMINWGMEGCVSDESVTNSSDVDYTPITPYHGWYTTVELNGYDGFFYVPREALDIDYCDTNPAMLIDEFNFNSLAAGDITEAWTLEQILALQTVYGIQDKVGFRHDPFMLHQANAASWTYFDPYPGMTHPANTNITTSFIALWIDRVVYELLSYYNLPLIHPQMKDLIKIFKQRMAMDSCNVVASIGIDSEGNAVGLTISGNTACQVSVSGVLLPTSSGTVTTETVGVETTSWIDVTTTAQTFVFNGPQPTIQKFSK